MIIKVEYDKTDATLTLTKDNDIGTFSIKGPRLAFVSHIHET